MRISIRSLIALGAVAVLVPFGTLPAGAAATIEKVVMAETPVLATPIDWAIDALVARRTSASNLSPADARIAREQLQMQFRSLSADKQQEISALAARLSGGEALERVQMIIEQAVKSDARRELATARAATSKTERVKSEGLAPLGPSSSDLVFHPTDGPCRVFDSRGSPGIFDPFESRQVYVYSTAAHWNWGNSGGTGFSDTGNCIGTEFFGAPPLSVVATVTVVNGNTTGALRAWNGGTTLTPGAVHAWNPGDQSSNTTVIAVDRSIAAYPGSGSKRDIGINNNSGGNVHVIIDVIGYFVHNQATALECTQEFNTTVNLSAGASQFITSATCPTGYSKTASQPWAPVTGLYTGTTNLTGCRITNTTGSAELISCDAVCCRVPGI